MTWPSEHFPLWTSTLNSRYLRLQLWSRSLFPTVTTEAQDSVTPAALAFCQCDYDSSLRNFFHHQLNMKEPIYEYEFPDHYVKPWRHFMNNQEEVRTAY